MFGRSSSATSVSFPATVPFLLIAFVLLQVVPLPASFERAFGIAVFAPLNYSSFTISATPYQTVSQLLALVTYLTAFYLVLMICADHRAKKRLVLALLALGVFEAFYGMIQFLTGWQQIFFYAKKFYLDDATGTYINRNHFAGLLEMVLPFAVVFALRHIGTLRQSSREEHAPARKLLSGAEFPFLLFWIFTAAALFAALVSSHSRMGILSALASLVAVLALAGTSKVSARARIAVGAFFLAGMVGLAVWVGSDPAIARFETLNDQYTHPGHDRLSIWRDTVHLIRRHPVLGSGFGSFATVYPSAQTAFLDNLVDHAHCDYLEIATELGVPGTILVFGGIFCILGLTVRHGKRGGEYDKGISFACFGSTTAILLHSLADFNLYIPANALVFAIILALAWSNAHREGGPRTLDSVELRRRAGESRSNHNAERAEVGLFMNLR